MYTYKGDVSRSTLFKLVTSFILVSDTNTNVSDFQSFSTVIASVVATSGEGDA
jgi:hypothetical protein